MSTITIAGRPIGLGHPCFVVAELSGNHHRDYATAEALIYAAKEAGADAVKTQIFTPDSLTIDCDDEPFLINWQGSRRTLYSLYSETAMPIEWHALLKGLADSLGLVYFASVFDRAGVDLGEQLVLPCYKVSSFELLDLPLIRCVASTGKPVLLSTGMATQREIYAAIAAVQQTCPNYKTGLALLKCTSAYPADASDSNLRTMEHWVQRWGWVSGISDHTLGIAVPVVAVTLGASIVEKHLTLSRADGGPDSLFSLEPSEFQAMVEAVRIAEASVGEVHYGPTDQERSNLAYRRSLYVVRDVCAGELLSPDNIRSIRPVAGLSPAHYDDIIGRRATMDIRRGTPLDWGMVEP